MTRKLAFIVAAAAAGMVIAAAALGQHSHSASPGVSQGIGKGPDAGDHDWIRDDPQYRMEPGGTHCCDASHCKPLDDSEVIPRHGGYYIPRTGQFFKEGQPGVYQSREWRFYGCGSPERLWCFFIAPGGV
ncbi:hypothetical protein [Ferrovibrio terrae]|uniref:hypothetical protein n=1 Tax=Ferrovibrio terrae TaxID=2594003 RepID=UPI003137E80F